MALKHHMESLAAVARGKGMEADKASSGGAA